MTVRKVLHMGDPRLLEVAKPVTEFDTPELDALVVDLFETMQVEDGVGLAAPQVGVRLRVVVFGYEIPGDVSDSETVPPSVLINPVIEPLSEEQDEAWEGCLSVPGMRGLVPRYRNIRYRGMDQKGNPIDRVVADFHARVVQHECDHLDGVLYPRRIRDMRNFGFLEELIESGTMPVFDSPCEDHDDEESVAVDTAQM
ncbi:MAG: peptide deformylase [Gammaproteobacteria bacterium]|nr:peptide deformylase [Gammaproteobacteria bacterium]